MGRRASSAMSLLRCFLVSQVLLPAWCLHSISGFTRACVSPRAMPLSARAQQRQPPWLVRVVLGDKTKAPLRRTVKRQLAKSSAGMVPPEFLDFAVDEAFNMLDAGGSVAPGGLEKLLTKPGELQSRRESLRRDLAKRLAASIDTPLGDEVEERLGGMIVDALVDDALAKADFLVTPSQRLEDLEGRVADVKAEMGLLRLALHRLTRAARSKLVREAGRLIGTSIVLLAASSLFTLGPSSLPHDVHGLQQLVAHMAARASAIASLVVGRIQAVLA